MLQCRTVALFRTMTSRPEPAVEPAPPAAAVQGGAMPSGATGVAGATPARPREIGGRPGPEPTRYGDWEKSGRCIDF
ncbi:MAG: DUF1674 domain-containing protein [Proteobacteria bacterium]|nr:DUF1674 domain-containing protein [Pseudomonadota bacterium]